MPTRLQVRPCNCTDNTLQCCGSSLLITSCSLIDRSDDTSSSWMPQLARYDLGLGLVFGTFRTRGRGISYGLTGAPATLGLEYTIATLAYHMTTQSSTEYIR